MQQYKSNCRKSGPILFQSSPDELCSVPCDLNCDQRSLIHIQPNYNYTYNYNYNYNYNYSSVAHRMHIIGAVTLRSNEAINNFWP